MLGTYISKDDYKYVISTLNLELAMFWPCDFVIYLGYLLAPFSCGVSLLLPNLCIGDAKKSFIKMVERMNRLKLLDKGLRISYR